MAQISINPKSHWSAEQISEFLECSVIPVRLSFRDVDGRPAICSLWFYYQDEALFAATHQSAHLIKVLKKDPVLGFEVSTNDYPYKGVRGKGVVTLTRENAETVLRKLIDRYLQGTNQSLADWLLGRVAEEYVIKISPTVFNAWDFSGRMSSRG